MFESGSEKGKHVPPVREVQLGRRGMSSENTGLPLHFLLEGEGQASLDCGSLKIRLED